MYDTLIRNFKIAANLFDPKKVEEIFKENMKNASTKTGLILFFMSGIITLIFGLLSSLEVSYILNYYQEIASQAIEGAAALSIESAVFLAIVDLFIWIPFFVIFIFIYEKIIYHVFKAIGGKGSFEQQYYASSLVSLALGFTTTLSLVVPIPCFNLIALVAMLALTVYFSLFVNVKAYEIVHGIPFLHCFIVSLLFIIPKTIVLTLAPEMIISFLGIGPEVI